MTADLIHRYAEGAKVEIKTLHGEGRATLSVAEKAQVTFRRLSVIGGGDDGHHFEIGEGALARGMAMAMRGKIPRSIRIGDNFSCGSMIINAYDADIEIGDDVLISSNVSIRTHDMHMILDAETGAVLNPAKPVIIEDHVWIGESVKIMPGVRIGRDSVIGIGTVVTRDVPPGCVFAGVPGKVRREGVTWRK
ncbi:MAG: acyltransferase [Alterinioella nitratireducens]|uniref:acyltransferase n=1 Tax=Alterinioella nitratireducens TaxID=2735915 RepID=UPI004058C378